MMTGVVGDEGAWVIGGRTGATVIAGALVVVEVSSVSRSASACWKAASVAASTTPDGSTPSAVWNSISACVSSGVH